MLSILANARNFLFTSDYPTDKVVYVHSLSFSVSAPSGGAYQTIAHGLPFTPLVAGEWSTAADYGVSYDYFSGPPATGTAISGGQLFNAYVNIYADATNIYLYPVNASGSTITVYARIFAYEPSDSTASLSATANSADNFALNTGYNYPKLFSEGIISPVAASTTYTVTHILGIVPQVMVWETAPSTISGVVGSLRSPHYYVTEQSGDPYQAAIIASTSSVTFTTGLSTTATRFDYRIYCDQSGVL